MKVYLHVVSEVDMTQLANQVQAFSSLLSLSSPSLLSFSSHTLATQEAPRCSTTQMVPRSLPLGWILSIAALRQPKRIQKEPI